MLMGLGVTLVVLLLVGGVALTNLAPAIAAVTFIEGAIGILLVFLALLAVQLLRLMRLRFAAAKVSHEVRQTLLKTGALQDAIFNSANFSIIATDAKGVIQIFNVGAEHMLGYRRRMLSTKLLRPVSLIHRKSSLVPPL